MSDEMPHPPFPDPTSKMLGLVIADAIGRLREGEATPEEAILHAAVHGWMEGHLEGHDCPGDEEEPGDREMRRALRAGKTIMTPDEAWKASKQLGVKHDYFVKAYDVHIVDDL